MEPTSTTLLPYQLDYTVPPPTAATVAPPGPVSDACMQMALGQMCEARYHRQMALLHSSAPWYGTVYAVVVFTVYVVLCLVLLLRARSSFSFSARANLQACRVVSRPAGNRRPAPRDVTCTDNSFSTESGMVSDPGCSSQHPTRPRSNTHT